MALLLNKTPEAYKAEKDRFLTDLAKFHENKGTPYKHLPMIDGKEIDLYQLYWIVTAHGGWEKVNSKSGWEDLLSLFDLSEATTNGALAIKSIYLRFLDTYEKNHFLRDEEDDNDGWYNDEEDSRSRRHKAQKIASTVPLIYNHNQHIITDEQRSNLGFSTNLFKRTDYDRLVMSLSSPLPNEQDFAINVCTLLSNEGRHTLKLCKCPKLVDFLLSHAGVFNHENMKIYMNEMYLSSRNYDLLQFWSNICEDDSVRDLMLRYSHDDNRKQLIDNVFQLKTSQQRMDAIKNLVDDDLKFNDDLFASGTKLGTQELCGQRILQIATILRNLSFEEENAYVLAKNETLLRFCLLCCSSHWNNLNQMGFDILSNVSCEVVLQQQQESCVTDVLLSTLTNSISSKDRFQVISSLDVLNKLCLQEANEEFIANVLVDQSASVFDQLANYLSLHDIHLLISTLECLYSLSCLGESSCNAIVRTHGAVDTLVSLITVEAQSYGPKACILMRVVETVPGSASGQLANPAAAATAAQIQRTAAAAVSSPTPTTNIVQPQNQSAQTATVIVQQSQQQAQVQQQQQPQQITVVNAQGQQQIVRGQIVQVQRPGGATATTIMPLPRHTINVGGQPRQIIIQRPTGVATSNQNQQIIIQQQPQVQQQQQVQVRQQQIVRPAIAQQQPQLAIQRQVVPQQQQQQTGSQHVQLRVSNDEANRIFCLSWLKATYEASPGATIQHEIMYKQYLASLHKLGKRDVISAQLYAASVRCLFGGSVGPNKKQLADGKTDQFFEGVKLRAQPLPLRVPASVNAQIATQQQTVTTQSQPVVVQQPQQQQQQMLLTTPQGVVVNEAKPVIAQPTAPSSPILTNLLHRKSPAPDNNPNETRPQVVAANNVVKQENGTHDHNDGNDKINNNGQMIINKKVEATNHLVNGTIKDVKNLEIIANNVNTAKLNGSMKRNADEMDTNITPAKHPHIDSTLTNGVCEDDNKTIAKPGNVIVAKNQIITSSGVIKQETPKQSVVILQPNVTTTTTNSNLTNGQQPQQSQPNIVMNGQVNGHQTSNPNVSSTPAAAAAAKSALSPTSVMKSPSNNSCNISPAAAAASAVGSNNTPVPKANPQTPYLCEWQGCMKLFRTPKEVEIHAIQTHCPIGEDDIPCLWSRCDGMKRKRFSLMTHLQDRHCQPEPLKMVAVHRMQMATTGKSEVRLPHANPKHPGYAPNAAYHAIKRHAAEFVNPKALAMGDEKEGPVTKSIRLTSSLILKNLVIFSSIGKKHLKAYESHLSTVALSNVESSRTVSQILYDMAQTDNNV